MLKLITLLLKTASRKIFLSLSEVCSNYPLIVSYSRIVPKFFGAMFFLQSSQ